MSEEEKLNEKGLKNAKLLKRLDFYQKLYDQGVPIKDEFKNELIEYGYIKDPYADVKGIVNKDIKIHAVSELRTDKEKEFDEIVNVYESESKFKKDETITVRDKSFTDIEGDERFIYVGGADIQTKDWKPKSIIYHEPDFVAWVDSFNKAFQKMIAYDKFQKYCQQAEDWLSDSSDIEDFNNYEEREQYAFKEFDRCSQNTLYFLDKYLLVMDTHLDDGYMDYKSKPVHKVIAFLVDSGYSLEIGKGRQIAASTTLGGIGVCKLMFQKNFFIKMIAQDKEKVQEIFDEKIKWAYSETPDWMYHEVKNDRDNILSLGKREKKGKRVGANSRIQVVAPSVAAINGGAPPLVFVDEAGYIGILGKMLEQARPVMFKQNPKTGLMEQKRQIVIWGTGGQMDKKGKSFEEEWNNTKDKWDKREFENGIVPIFFDYTTRPGMTQEHYDNEKKNATTEGPDRDSKMVSFRQTYPSVPEDMFLTSAKLLVSPNWISEQLERIRSIPEEYNPKVGFFEPIFDTSRPANEHDELPYRVIGAEFVPTEDGDSRASVTIMWDPVRGWANRYYQGTDPIMTDDGYSNMASTIWDAYHNTTAAVLNYRDSKHKNTFLQTMLLGLYYDPEKTTPVKELVESNIGQAYIDYKDYRGHWKSFVYRTELEPVFHGGQQEIGIDNRGKRTGFIISRIHELVVTYGERIYHETLFSQLKTFVCTIKESGAKTWGTSDAKKYHDDVLFSTVFAYICSSAFNNRPPTEIKSKSDRFTYKYVPHTDSNGNLSRKRVKVRNY